MFQAAEMPSSSGFPRFRFIKQIRSTLGELEGNKALLLPLRIVLGLAWMWVGASQLSDPAWKSGDAVTVFLQGQLASGTVQFPFYETLITGFFLPNAMAFAWIVMMGQWLVGLAIITGTLTNLALLFALFMNINFVLAGSSNPSSVYIAIQGVLFWTNAGTIIGFDSVLSTRIRSRLLVAQPDLIGWREPQPDAPPDEDIFMGGCMDESNIRDSKLNEKKRFGRKLMPEIKIRFSEKWCYLGLAVLCGLSVVSAAPAIYSNGPHQLTDPVILLFVMSGLGCLLSLILFQRAS